MKVFDNKADIDLDIMQANQDLVHVTNASLRGLRLKGSDPVMDPVMG